MATRFIPMEGLPSQRVEVIKHRGRTSGFQTKDMDLFTVKLWNGTDCMVLCTDDLSDKQGQTWATFLRWPLFLLEEVVNTETVITYKMRRESNV